MNRQRILFPHGHRMTSTNVDSFLHETGRSGFLTVLLATTIFQCWHIILFFSGWATMVVLISEKETVLALPNTLITVFGTVLGFVISYRTSSSFERYNDGRRYWSSIALASRGLARTIWVHVPQERPSEDATEKEKEQLRLKTIIEKKAGINLIEAFAVSVKHYLRGEETIFYEDLYHYVKFLPVYALPTGLSQMPASPISERPEESLVSAASAILTEINLQSPVESQKDRLSYSSDTRPARPFTLASTLRSPREPESSTSTPAPTLYEQEGISIDIEKGVNAHAPAGPMTTFASSSRPDPVHSAQTGLQRRAHPLPANDPPKWSVYDVFPLSLFVKPLLKKGERSIDIEKAVISTDAPAIPVTSSSNGGPKVVPSAQARSHRRISLFPANDRPKWAVFSVFPVSLFIKPLLKSGKSIAKKKAAKLKARAGNVDHNIPLEITFYLSSYIAEIQRRKIADVPTLNMLFANLSLLSDSLAGLDRILTTPIPFSYTFHLWAVVTIFVMLLPFQLWRTFRYATIPATAIAAFIFFGFLAAGEEIENPFGYDMNNLDLDYFTQNIRVELAAMTSRPAPGLEDWALSPDNNNVFGKSVTPLAPQDWMEGGEQAVWEVLRRGERGMS